MQKFVKDPYTGEIFAYSDEAKYQSALKEGRQDLNAQEAAVATQKKAAKDLYKEEGMGGSAKAIGQGAGRAVIDLATAVPKLLGGNLPSSADIMEDLGMGNAEDARLRTISSPTAAGVGAVLPDIAGAVATGGGSAVASTAAKTGAKALVGKLAKGLAVDSALGGLAGSQSADELAFREGRTVTLEERREAAMFGAAAGGGLGLLGKGASAGLSKGLKKLRQAGSAGLGDKHSFQRKALGSAFQAIPTGKAAKGSGAGFFSSLKNKAAGGVEFDNFGGVAGRARNAAKNLGDETGGLRRSIAKGAKEADGFAEKAVASDAKRLAAEEAAAAFERKLQKSLEHESGGLRTKNAAVEAKVIPKIKAIERELESGHRLTNEQLAGRVKLSDEVRLAEGSANTGLTAAKEGRLAHLDSEMAAMKNTIAKDPSKNWTKLRKRIHSVQRRKKDILTEGAANRKASISSAKKKLTNFDRKTSAKTTDRLNELSKKKRDLEKELKAAKEANSANSAHKAKGLKEEYSEKARQARSRAEKENARTEDFLNQESATRKTNASNQADLDEAIASQERLTAAHQEALDKGIEKADGVLGSIESLAKGYLEAAGRPQLHFLALSAGGSTPEGQTYKQVPAVVQSVLKKEVYEPKPLKNIALDQYSVTVTNPTASYAANAEMIQEIANDPTVLSNFIDENSLEHLSQVAPELYQKRKESVANAIRVMAEYPPPFKTDELTGAKRISASRSEAMSYKDNWETAFSPQKFINDFGQGRLNEEKWGIAQEVYPDLASSFQEQLVTSLRESQPSLSQTQRQQLSIVTGSRDIMTTGQYQMVYTQSVSAASSEQSQPPQEAPPPNPQQTSEAFGTLSQQSMLGTR